MRQPYQVLVHAARPSSVAGQWEYLLLRRMPHIGGFWQGVTGGVEEGETIPHAAARELFEETGLAPRRLAYIGVSYTYAMLDRWRPLYPPGVEELREDVFVAVMDAARPDVDRPPALSAEHDAWQWVSLARGLCLLRWPENIEALQRVDAWLGGAHRCREQGLRGSGRVFRRIPSSPQPSSSRIAVQPPPCPSVQGATFSRFPCV